MAGGSGDDFYRVDLETDVIHEANDSMSGHDVVTAESSYTLPQGVEDLHLTGSADLDGTGNELNNYMGGNDGSNILTASSGDDTLNGGDGLDYLFGGLGDDLFVVNQNYDEVFELNGEGVDTIYTDLDWQLAPNTENLFLTGTSPVIGLGTNTDNYIAGNIAANLIEAYGGNDTLEGGGGSDTLDGLSLIHI